MSDKTTAISAAESGERRRVTWEMIEQYLARHSAPKDAQTATEAVYRSTLTRFYRYLPEDKQIDRYTLPEWEKQLLALGKKPATVRFYLRTVRTFLRRQGFPEEWLAPLKPTPEKLNDAPELSRAEYLFLLRRARELGKEKAYLIIKTLCQTGLKSMELSQLTVDALQKGGVWVEIPRETKHVRIPPSLREELSRYAARQGITEGAIFVTRDGQPLHRVQVWKLLRQVCRRTGLPEEKWQLANLHKLYWDTQKALHAAHSENPDAAYDALLAREEEEIRWTDESR